ncbi:MAG: CAP domain-containing protein [Candidatus Saccharibacteria bacterium]
MAKSKIKKNILPKSFFVVFFRVLKLLFVPHHANNYKPHIIRTYGIAILMALVVGSQLGYSVVKTGSVLGTHVNIDAKSLLDQTNAERQKAAEPALKLNDELSRAAELKAKDMFANQYWAHNSPSGAQPWKWFGDVGYNYNSAGENLAKNFVTTSATMTAWMNSPSHRANILNADYREVGFAVEDGRLNGKSTTLVVAMYGSPASGVVAGAKTPVNGAELSKPLSILAQINISIKSMSPAMLVGLVMVVLAMLIALISHGHRHKLPKFIRSTWRRHHELYKGIGLAAVAVILLFVSAGGQI